MMETITLYRGLETPFDPNHDMSSTDAPNGYSTWTNNLSLAKEYAGSDGFIYEITLPTTLMGEDYIDVDGERPLFFNNEKAAGLHGVSGDEFLLYHDHDEFDANMILPLNEAVDINRPSTNKFFGYLDSLIDEDSCCLCDYTFRRWFSVGADGES